MKIVDNIFYVDSMTTLRYAIPFIKTTKKLLDKDVLLVYNTVCNRKYNSNIRHESLLQKICKKHDIKLFKQERDDDLKTCNLFCLENTSKGIVTRIIILSNMDLTIQVFIKMFLTRRILLQNNILKMNLQN